jgi:putative peptidoglycan lipid II flippase
MLKVESYKKGILLSTIFNIFNKGLVFLNALLVAHFYKVEEGTDIFFYVYNSVILLGAFFTSMNNSVIIPESMRLRVQSGNERAIQFLNFFIYLYTVLIVLGILIICISPVGFFSRVSNFSAQQLDDNLILLYLSLPLFGMICIINLFSDILSSYKFFTISMIVGIVNGLMSMLFIIFFHSKLGIKAVFFGLIISYCLNIFLLLYLLKKFLHWKFTDITRKVSKRVWKNLGFAQLGNLTSTLSAYTPIYILSGFNAGIITALTFAQQFSSLPNSLITAQFSSVAGIKFNELYSKQEHEAINETFTDTANILHFLLIPVSFYIFYFSSDIVFILLKYSSLSAEIAGYVTLFMKYLGFLIPLLVINTLIARLFMASRKVRESFWYQVVLNLSVIAGLYIAIRNFGVVAYPITMIVSYVLNIFFCFLLSKRYFTFLNFAAIVRHLFLLIVINAVVGTAVFYTIKLINPGSALLRLIAGFLIYALLLIVINNLFRINSYIISRIHVFLRTLKHATIVKNL